MSRRVSLAGLILVVAIWAGVLLTPQLRLSLDSQLRSPDEWVGQWIQNRLEYKDGLERLLREHPNDPRVLVAEFESQRDSNISYEDFTKAQLRHYDKLIAQFPRESWLIQNRLRLSTTGGLPIDTGEMQAQSKRDALSWLSREETLQALKIAERGAQLEPQNSFYDWMRAAFLFALEQPEAALRALADGARKPRFEDGVLRDMQIKIEVREMQGPLLWEERMGILASMLWPHLARFQNVNRAAVWRGVLAERNGNHERALEIYRNQMKLAATMRRDSTNLLSVLVAEAALYVTWGGLTRQVGKNALKHTQQQRAEKLAKAFAVYAQKYGRPDLARLTLRLAQESELPKLQNVQQLGYIFGAEKLGTMESIGRSHWVGTILLRITGVLIASWLALSVVSLVVRDARVFTSLFDVLASTLFALVTVAVVFYAALRIGISQPLFLQLFGGDDVRKDNLGVLTPYIETVLMWLPLGLTILYCGVATLWRGRKTPRLSLPKPYATSNENSDMTSQIKSGLRWSATVLAVLGFCYLVVVILALLHLPGIGINNEIYLFQTAPFVLAALVFYVWRQRKAYLHNWPYLLAWCRSTLGALVILGGVAYLCTSLLALPLRREADARLDDFIARGEVAVLRDMAAKRVKGS